MITPIIILCLISFPLIASLIYAKINGTEILIGKYACWGLGIAFIFFFVGHFVQTQGMIDMLPPWIPMRKVLIYATGILELIIGIMLFLPRYQTMAAVSAIIIFIVFFPANIYAALNGVGLGGHQWGPVYLLIRTPLQLILIFWAYYYCIKLKERTFKPE